MGCYRTPPVARTIRDIAGHDNAPAADFGGPGES